MRNNVLLSLVALSAPIAAFADVNLTANVCKDVVFAADKVELATPDLAPGKYEVELNDADKAKVKKFTVNGVEAKNGVATVELKSTGKLTVKIELNNGQKSEGIGFKQIKLVYDYAADAEAQALQKTLTDAIAGITYYTTEWDKAHNEGKLVLEGGSIQRIVSALKGSDQAAYDAYKQLKDGSLKKQIDTYNAKVEERNKFSADYAAANSAVSGAETKLAQFKANYKSSTGDKTGVQSRYDAVVKAIEDARKKLDSEYKDGKAITAPAETWDTWSENLSTEEDGILSELGFSAAWLATQNQVEEIRKAFNSNYSKALVANVPQISGKGISQQYRGEMAVINDEVQAYIDAQLKEKHDTAEERQAIVDNCQKKVKEAEAQFAEPWAWAQGVNAKYEAEVKVLESLKAAIDAAEEKLDEKTAPSELANTRASVKEQYSNLENDLNTNYNDATNLDKSEMDIHLDGENYKGLKQLAEDAVNELSQKADFSAQVGGVYTKLNGARQIIVANLTSSNNEIQKLTVKAHFSDLVAKTGAIYNEFTTCLTERAKLYKESLAKVDDFTKKYDKAAYDKELKAWTELTNHFNEFVDEKDAGGHVTKVGKVTQYKDWAVASNAAYTVINDTLGSWNAQIKDLKTVVKNTAVAATVGDDTKTYGEWIGELEAKVAAYNGEEGSLTAAEKLNDEAFFKAITAISVEDHNALRDLVATLKAQYDHNATQEAVKTMAAATTNKANEVSTVVEKLIATLNASADYVASLDNKKADSYLAQATDLKTKLDALKRDVETYVSKANSSAATNDDVAALSVLVANADDYNKQCSDLKKDAQAYIDKVEANAKSKTDLIGDNGSVTQAKKDHTDAKAKITEEGQDPSKSVELTEAWSKADEAYTKVIALIADSAAEERLPGAYTFAIKDKVESLESKVAKANKLASDFVHLADSLKANFTAYNELIKLLGTDSEYNKKVVAAQTEIDKIADADVKKHFQGVLDAQKASKTTAEADIKKAYDDVKAAEKKAELSAKITAFTKKLADIPTNIKDNEDNYQAQKKALYGDPTKQDDKGALAEAQELLEFVLANDKSSKQQDWLNQINAQIDSLTSVAANYETQYKVGATSKANTDKVNTARAEIAKIKADQSKGYNDAINADNLTRFNAFKTQYDAATKAWNTETAKVEKYHNDNYDAELRQAVENVLTGIGTDLYDYKAKLEELNNKAQNEFDAIDETNPTLWNVSNSYEQDAKSMKQGVEDAADVIYADVKVAAKQLFDDYLIDAKDYLANAKTEMSRAIAGAEYTTSDAEIKEIEDAEKTWGDYDYPTSLNTAGYLTALHEDGSVYQTIDNESKSIVKTAFASYKETALTDHTDEIAVWANKYDEIKQYQKEYANAKANYDGTDISFRDYVDWESHVSTIIASYTSGKSNLNYYKSNAELAYSKAKQIWNTKENYAQTQTDLNTLLGGEQSEMSKAIEGASAYAGGLKVDYKFYEQLIDWVENNNRNDISYRKLVDNEWSEDDFTTAVSLMDAVRTDSAEVDASKADVIYSEIAELLTDVQTLKSENEKAIAELEQKADAEGLKERLQVLKGQIGVLAGIEAGITDALKATISPLEGETVLPGIDAPAELDFATMRQTLLQLEGQLAASSQAIYTAWKTEAYINEMSAQLAYKVSQFKNAYDETVKGLTNIHERAQKEIAYQLLTKDMNAKINALEESVKGYKEAGTTIFYQDAVQNEMSVLDDLISDLTNEVVSRSTDWKLHDSYVNDMTSENGRYQNAVSGYESYVESLEFIDPQVQGKLNEDKYDDNGDLIRYSIKNMLQKNADKIAEITGAADKYGDLISSNILPYRNYNGSSFGAVLNTRDAANFDIQHRFGVADEVVAKTEDYKTINTLVSEALGKYALETGEKWVDEDVIDKAREDLSKKLIAAINYNSNVYNGYWISEDIEGKNTDSHWVDYLGSVESGWKGAEYIRTYIEENLKNKISDFSTLIDESKYVLGNADFSTDKEIDVADYTTLLEWIKTDKITTDKGLTARELKAADVNGDNKLNIGDLTMLANYINGVISNFDAASRPVRRADFDSELHVTVLPNGNTQRVAIQMNGSFVGAQMDVQLPAGFTLVSESLGAAANGHVLSSADLANGKHRIVVSSTGNEAFNEGAALIYLDVQGTGNIADIRISDAYAADSRATVYALGGIDGDATGINGVENGQSGVISKIYNAGGQLMNQVRKGINIIRNADGSTKKVYK